MNTHSIFHRRIYLTVHWLVVGILKCGNYKCKCLPNVVFMTNIITLILGNGGSNPILFIQVWCTHIHLHFVCSKILLLKYFGEIREKE